MKQFDKTAGGGDKPRKAGQTVYTLPAAAASPKPVEIRAGHHRRTLHAGRSRATSRSGDAVIVGLVTSQGRRLAVAPARPAPGGGRRF